MLQRESVDNTFRPFHLMNIDEISAVVMLLQVGDPCFYWLLSRWVTWRIHRQFIGQRNSPNEKSQIKREPTALNINRVLRASAKWILGRRCAASEQLDAIGVCVSIRRTQDRLSYAQSIQLEGSNCCTVNTNETRDVWKSIWRIWRLWRIAAMWTMWWAVKEIPFRWKTFHFFL